MGTTVKGAHTLPLRCSLLQSKLLTTLTDRASADPDLADQL